MNKEELYFSLGILIGILVCKLFINSLYQWGVGLWILWISTIILVILEILKLNKKKPDK